MFHSLLPPVRLPAPNQVAHSHLNVCLLEGFQISSLPPPPADFATFFQRDRLRPRHTNHVLSGSNSTVRLHLWDGSLPLDSFRAVQVPATEAVGPIAVNLKTGYSSQSI